MAQSEKQLGEFVRMARGTQGLSQETLAVQTGISRRTISSIENDGLNPGFEVVYRLVRELNLPLEPLFYPERWVSEVKSQTVRQRHKQGRLCTMESSGALGNVVRNARKAEGLSQNQMAELAGVCSRTISAIENERVNPRFDVVKRLARTLKLPLEELFYPERKGGRIEK